MKPSADFGATEQPPAWRPPSEHTMHLQQLSSTIEHYVKERTRITNQLEAFLHTGRTNKKVQRSLKRMHSQVDKEISALEKEIDELIQELNYERTYYANSL